MSTTKKADSRGRLHLGESFAGQMFIVEEFANGDMLVKRAAIIPASEKWLFDNKTALRSIKRGIQQASAGEFVESPDPENDSNWINELEDEK